MTDTLTLETLNLLTPGHEWTAMHGFPESGSKRYQVNLGLVGVYVKSTVQPVQGSREWHGGIVWGCAHTVVRRRKSPEDAARDTLRELANTVESVLASHEWEV